MRAETRHWSFNFVGVKIRFRIAFSFCLAHGGMEMDGFCSLGELEDVNFVLTLIRRDCFLHYVIRFPVTQKRTIFCLPTIYQITVFFSSTEIRVVRIQRIVFSIISLVLYSQKTKKYCFNLAQISHKSNISRGEAVGTWRKFVSFTFVVCSRLDCYLWMGNWI